jgi:hypothetical protein
MALATGAVEQRDVRAALDAEIAEYTRMRGALLAAQQRQAGIDSCQDASTGD